MNRTRTLVTAGVLAAGLVPTGCGGPGTPTAAPHLAAPASSSITPSPTTNPDAPPVTTDTPTPAPANAASTAPTVDPDAPLPRPTAPSTPAQIPEPAPAAPAPPPDPAAAPPVSPPTDAPPSPAPPVVHPPSPLPAPAQSAPSPPRPVAAPVVKAPPPPAPPTPVSSWSGIYAAFVTSHPGPTYRVFDTGNYGNTATNGAGTVVNVNIAPRTPVAILQSVIVHEYGHYLQNHTYGPGLGYAVRAVGSVDLDHAADCFALAHGATWVNYGCTNTATVQGILARMGG